jgi:hypothetical protein
LHFGHNFLSFCSLAELVKRKPVKLIGKHFPEVEIELRRKIMVVSQAPASKWRVTVPQSLNQKRQIRPSMHDLWGLLCVDQIINAASIYFDRIYSHTLLSSMNQAGILRKLQLGW